MISSLLYVLYRLAFIFGFIQLFIAGTKLDDDKLVSITLFISGIILILLGLSGM